METSQRVVKEIMEYDNSTLSLLHSSMQRLVEILYSSAELVQDYSKLADSRQAPNILSSNILQVNISVSIFKTRSKK